MKKKTSFYEAISARFRLVLFDSSYKEVSSARISRLQIFLVIFLLFLTSSCLTALTIAYSPLREYIPGYSPPHLSEGLIALSLQTDSLLEEVQIKEQKYVLLEKILRGEPLNDSVFYTGSSKNSIEQISLKASSEDSLFREEIEREVRFNVFSEKGMTPIELVDIAFYPPLKGFISDSFDLEKRHFGIDVIASDQEPIKSTLPGTVIISDWTTDTGYTISIQHENNLISCYKHNSVLLKDVGEKVKAGDVIAIIGSSGTLSTGPHLHFELWHKGIAINPEHHILF